MELHSNNARTPRARLQPLVGQITLLARNKLGVLCIWKMADILYSVKAKMIINMHISNMNGS